MILAIERYGCVGEETTGRAPIADEVVVELTMELIACNLISGNLCLRIWMILLAVMEKLLDSAICASAVLDLLAEQMR